MPIFFCNLSIAFDIEVGIIPLLYNKGVARGIIDQCDVVKHWTLIAHMCVAPTVNNKAFEELNIGGDVFSD